MTTLPSRSQSKPFRFGLSCAGVLASALSLALAINASAVDLVTYNFDSGLAPTIAPDAGVTDASVIAAATGGDNSPLTQTVTAGIQPNGSTYTSSAPLNNSSSTTGPAGRAFTRSFLNGPAETFQHYIGFSLAIEPGQSLDLSDFTFDLGFRRLAATAMLVQYSVTSDFSLGAVTLGQASGFNSSGQSFLGYGAGDTLGVTQPSGNTNISWNRYSHSAALTGDEQITGTAYFRVWLRGGTGPTGDQTSNVFIDNVVVSGSVVPEPSSALLLLGGCAFLLRCQRRA